MDSLTAENREKMVSPYAYGHGRLRTCGLHLGRSLWTILYGGDIFRQFIKSLHCILGYGVSRQLHHQIRHFSAAARCLLATR